MIFRYCPLCGNLLVVNSDEEKQRPSCQRCGYVQYRNPTVGVAVIVMQSDQILLVKRLGSYEDKWCIPCGHVEWDEDIRDSAKRELKEETGLEVELGDVFDVHSNFHDQQHQTVGVWFWGKVVGGTLNPGSDAKETKFFRLHAISYEMMAFPTDILVCKRLRMHLSDRMGKAISK